MEGAEPYLMLIIYYLITLLVLVIVIGKREIVIRNETIERKNRCINAMLKEIHKHDDYHRNG